MQRKRIPLISTLLILAVLAGHYFGAPWSFYRKVSSEEAQLRLQVVAQAESFLGCQEGSPAHQAILDCYNSHSPLAREYSVQPEDSWCATFVSSVSIACGLTDILPTECGCQRQIALFQALDCWEESDSAVPQPGDVIYYDWEDRWFGDCTGWSDHVGIVVGVKWPFAKIIEGNKDDQVAYRYILLNGPYIRGYGKPDYLSASK